MTDVSLPPSSDAPYKEQVAYYHSLAALPPVVPAADILIPWGAGWLLEHGEISRAEYDRLMRSVVPSA
jgi:hypothetical protein